MYAHAAYLLVAVVAVATLTERWRLSPFVALVAVTVGFGYAADFPTGLIGRDFATGFGRTLAAAGLPIVAGAMIAAIAEGSGAAALIARATARWRGAGRTAATLALGLLGGVGGSATAALAVLAPLGRAMGGRGAGGAAAAPTLALAISAGHGLLFPSPVVIAATAILDADWWTVLAVGVPAAVAAALAGWAVAALAGGQAADGRAAADDPAPATAPRRGVIGLLAASAALLVLLAVQSLGDLPSEPFGGGRIRDQILGLGRPLTLLVAGVGILLLATWRFDRTILTAGGRLERAVAGVAPLLLAVGAAGGLQMVAQRTGMAELIGEQASTLPLGLAVPFLVAAVVKTLQGSSLVAAIAAAGMVEPLLAPLGLGDPAGRALAVVALGAGAMAATHVVDGFFWLAAREAGFRPLRALACLSGGTLVQGLAALAVVALIAAAIL